MFYANQKSPVIKGLASPGFQGHDMRKVAEIHKKVCSHPELIDSFIAENPFKFNQEELDIVNSWKNCIEGEFFILSHSKEHTIFLSPEKEPKDYGVLGLSEPLQI